MLQAAAGCSPEGYRVVLPDEYVGWVRVDYRVPGAAPLPAEDGFQILLIPESGVLVTSSDMRTSPKRDEVFFERSGKRIRAPYSGRGITIASSTSEASIITWWVFFGPEDAIRTEEARRKVNGDWIPGRLKSVPPAK
jgi:hypothetical protein